MYDKALVISEVPQFLKSVCVCVCVCVCGLCVCGLCECVCTNTKGTGGSIIKVCVHFIRARYSHSHLNLDCLSDLRLNWDSP